MITFIHKLILIIFLFVVSIVSAQETNKMDTDKLYKDLKIYREIVENGHSGMYLYTSKEEFNTIFKDAEAKIPSIKSFREFYNLMASIHTKINCGHSSFHPTQNIIGQTEGVAIPSFFPFKVKFLKDVLVVAEDFKDLKKGDEIKSINGNSIDKITTETFKLISSDGYNTTFKYRQLEEDFSRNYFIVFGASKEYTIQYIPLGKKEQKTSIVAGITIENLNRTIVDTTFEKPYYFEILDNNTAQLTVNTFSTDTPKGQKKFFKFLKKTFKEINKKEISNLIVDIRENTGGDDGNDMELASYFINKPFKENKFRKLNTIEGLPPLPEYLTDSWYNMFDIDIETSPKDVQDEAKEMMQEQAEKGKDGAYYWKEESIIKRTPPKNRFKGQAYILTSGKVFSGGGLFSALVRDKSNAIFVGEETGGGYYRHTGTIPLIYKLPYSGLVFSIFIVINEQDVDQKLVPNGRGTMPQFEVYQTPKEFINNTDAVLNKAKELIKNKQ